METMLFSFACKFCLYLIVFLMTLNSISTILSTVFFNLFSIKLCFGEPASFYTPIFVYFFYFLIFISKSHTLYRSIPGDKNGYFLKRFLFAAKRLNSLRGRVH